VPCRISSAERAPSGIGAALASACLTSQSIANASLPPAPALPGDGTAFARLF
jgi:hypothetical protein